MCAWNEASLLPISLYAPSCTQIQLGALGSFPIHCGPECTKLTVFGWCLLTVGFA